MPGSEPPCWHGTPAGETCRKCGDLGKLAAAWLIKGLTGKWPAELTGQGREPQLGDTVTIRATKVRGENAYCVGFQRFTVPAAAEVTVVEPGGAR